MILKILLLVFPIFIIMYFMRNGIGKDSVYDEKQIKQRVVIKTIGCILAAAFFGVVCLISASIAIDYFFVEGDVVTLRYFGFTEIEREAHSSSLLFNRVLYILSAVCSFFLTFYYMVKVKFIKEIESI